MYDPNQGNALVVRPIVACGVDENGAPNVTVAFRDWRAAQKKAYTDLLGETVRTRDDGSTIVPAGTLFAVATALTCVSSTGFGPLTLDDGRAVPFDVSNVDHLGALPSSVYDEIEAHAREVHPLVAEADEDETEPEGVNPLAASTPILSTSQVTGDAGA